MWVCECDCGSITEILQQSLTSGNTKRCGKHPKNEYIIEGLYALLDVSTKSHIDSKTKIDIEDVERVINYKRKGNRLRWVLHDSDPSHISGKYVVDTDRKARLHRFIMRLEDPRLIVDHINGDTMDNRKENLKIITRGENNKNQRKHINNTSGYTGVTYEKQSGLYVSAIQLHNKKLHIGRYDTLEQANIAYRASAKTLNFSDRHGL